MTTDVFTFLSLRAPNSAEEKNFHARYIKDNYLGIVKETGKETFKIKRIERFIGRKSHINPQTDSYLGCAVFYQVYCNPANSLLQQAGINKTIVQLVLDEFKLPAIDCTTPNLPSLDYYENYAFQKDGNFYFIPYKLLLDNAGYLLILKATKIIKSFLQQGGFNKNDLVKQLEIIFDNKLLAEVVFRGSSISNPQSHLLTNPGTKDSVLYSEEFLETKAMLFETLYRSYIIRRVTSVNLEAIIEGLRTLHLLEWLAVDTYLENPTLTDNNKDLKFILDFIVAEMGFKSSFLTDTKALKMYFDAMPVIHPIFARLAWYKKPFNEIKPIGIGDLKVVKQTLLSYAPGEISYIHNVMKGESYKKSHRRLDKTEDTFSFSSEQSSDTEREGQSTDKFEIKREADNVLKTDLQINANASFTYNGPILANITGGMSYHTSSEDSQKLSSNFARDVMNKAVSKVQNKASQNRSSTKISEIEEINKHGFINTDPAATHVSGIYRWVDKKYQSQVYNYGKRLMFEFVIPEPAAFYIQSKLKVYEMFELNIPEKPVPPHFEVVKIPNPENPTTELTIYDLNFERIFNLLQEKYDLAEFTYPQIVKKCDFLNQTNGKNFFEGSGMPDDMWSSSSFNCKVDAKDYNLSQLYLDGAAAFWSANDGSQIERLNTLAIFINGVQLKRIEDNTNVYFEFRNTPLSSQIAPMPIVNGDENVILTFGFQDGNYFRFSVRGEWKLSGTAMDRWTIEVYRKIVSIEEKRIKPINEKEQVRYDSELASYNNKLAALKAQTINDLIQGKSEAYNKDIILRELKKHCITMLTKEFDQIATDDILIYNDAFPIDSTRNIPYQKFTVDESADPVTSGFNYSSINVGWPAIDIDKAKFKARYIQFLEQAFEWQQLAYIFYPYFWADQKKWISLMNHLDYTDKNMSDFLQAGSVRVLLAVQPSYNEAVMHYLATREPWEGGTTPIIGDPLYLPLFEEIHKQQDDLKGAKPEGEPWEFTVPTSLVWLQGSKDELPRNNVFE